MKKINCPICGKELIRLEPFEESVCEFWCDDCNIDIAVTKNREEFVEYVRIIIYGSADVKELENHLSMNGYDFGIDKNRNFLFVNMEEIDYVKTILEDRNIEYSVTIY